MNDEQIASIQYAADWLSRSEDIGNRKHGERLSALLSASIADTAKPVIDKSMVKRLMVQHGLDKSHESIAETAVANCATCGAVGTVTSTKARCTLCGMFADTAGAKPVTLSAEQEKERFEAVYRHLDLSQQLNAWNVPVYSHSHVQALWQGWLDRSAAPPAPSVADAKCMCSGLGPCEKLSNCRKAPSVADAAGASEIRALIADDAYAMSFQTMGQYRSALLNAIKKETGK